MPGLGHDRPLRRTGCCGGGGEAGTQRVTGISVWIETGASGCALDDACHGTVGEPVAADAVMSVDGSEQRPAGDATGRAPRLIGAHRTGAGVLAPGDAELATVALLIGLAATDLDPQSLSNLLDVVDVEGHQLAAPEAAGETEEEHGAIA